MVNHFYLGLSHLTPKLLAPLLATAALWGGGSNPDFSQKYKMGDISKGVGNKL